ncbi:MAG TPA: Flp pilus assembly protein CpaB [Nocardioides sp.]|uniref:Flp pilus assembly protein CpaB n=1 Tax=Nocardioides sp. TaxID=35761 RepID=UPI002E304FB5|nr:Flp pilus assembly protein CpaB [Nocardioides sp.]HEX5088324.1 Flp pilus assembly protein CpaB [Nocardioides sp.]
MAVLVAALGSALVFLYTKGADTRAEKKFDTVEVLEATAVINPGEKIEDAQAAGKLALTAVSKDSLLDGYQSTTDSLTNTVSLGTIYPGEQIISAKWGASASVQSSLQIPDGMMAKSVNLTDPGRVAGFVNPGSTVAVFYSGTDPQSGEPFTRLLLDKVTVLGVGSTTPVSTTTTDQSGASTTEQLPRTLITLALTQVQVEKTTWAEGNGELSFALLTDKSTVQPDASGMDATKLFQ